MDFYVQGVDGAWWACNGPAGFDLGPFNTRDDAERVVEAWQKEDEDLTRLVKMHADRFQRDRREMMRVVGSEWRCN